MVKKIESQFKENNRVTKELDELKKKIVADKQIKESQANEI
jgi:hypothetical protein